MDYKKLIDELEDMKHASPDEYCLDEAMDIIADYEKVTAQLSLMMQKYEAAKDAVSRGMGVYTCPDCGGMVSYGNEHCRNCGRRLGWRLGAGRNKGGGNTKKGGRKRK